MLSNRLYLALFGCSTKLFCKETLQIIGNIVWEILNSVIHIWHHLCLLWHVVKVMSYMTPPVLLWHVVKVISHMTSPSLSRNVTTPGTSSVNNSDSNSKAKRNSSKTLLIILLRSFLIVAMKFLVSPRMHCKNVGRWTFQDLQLWMIVFFSRIKLIVFLFIQT